MAITCNEADEDNKKMLLGRECDNFVQPDEVSHARVRMCLLVLDFSRSLWSVHQMAGRRTHIRTW